MKYKLIFALVVLCAILASVLFSNLEQQTLRFRVQQHLSATSDLKTDDPDVSALPIVEITTDGKYIPGETIVDHQGMTIGYTVDGDGNKMSEMKVSIIDQLDSQNHISDTPSIETKSLIRYRGNSSRRFDKKGYLLRFVDDAGNDNDQNVMGMGKDSEWVLHGPFLDKTLMRNYLCMNIIGQIMPYTPDVRYCRLYIDGEYKGLYLMMESIRQGEHRVNITKTKNNDTHISYIVRVDSDPEDVRSLNTFSFYTHLTADRTTRYSVLYPGTNRLTQQWKTYIEDDISKFEKALFSYDFNDSQQGYRAYIDIDSFVDYYVFMEFFGVRDFGSRSTYLYKDAKGKLALGPAWDFNNAMDNFFQEQSPYGIQYYDRLWYRMLLKDEAFVRKVVNRYHELRSTVLNQDYLLNYIDDTVSYLGTEIDRNFEVWGYSFDASKLDSYEQLTPIERNITSYEDAIVQMKEYIQKRGKWLDEHIETLYQYCHESKNKDALLK